MESRRFLPLVCTALLTCVPGAFAQNVDMGATFDAISSTVTEVETTFRDARALTRKKDDGGLETLLYDLEGKLLVSLTRERGRPFVEVSGPGARWRHRIQLPPQSSFAADWNNAQAWQLWRDARASNTDLAATSLPPVALRGRLLRFQNVHDAETRATKSIDVDDETMSVRTRFPKYVALATKRENRTLRPEGTYATFTSRLQSIDGVTLGYIRFFKRERMVSWTFGTGDRGIVREETVKGGFKFTPNMAWANVQAVSFHEHPPKKPVPASAFGNQISSCSAALRPLAPAKASTATSSRAGAGVGASIKNRVLSWFGALRFLPSRTNVGFTAQPTAPARLRTPFFEKLAASAASSATYVAIQDPCDGQSDGCTGLHWLDNSIFRPCCDRHDLCFEKPCESGSPPCTMWSWIVFWNRWDCTACNAAAVLCFVTGNGGGGGDGGNGGGDPADYWCWSDMDCPDGYMCEWDGRCRSWFDDL